MSTKVMQLLEDLREDSGYKDFFNQMLKKYNVKSPAELKGDQKKKFFQAIEDGWTSEDPATDDKDVEEQKIRALIRSIMQEIINEKI